MTHAARQTDLLVRRGGFALFRGRRFPCAIGRGGFRLAKREGDGATPVGFFRLEHALYRPDRVAAPRTCLPVAPIRVWDGWSDDPEDPAYNRAVRQPHPWRCEGLRRPDPLYEIVVVFDANRSPVLPGAGSALFLHVWRKPRHPTAGCVAFPREDLLWILERWTPLSRLIVRG